MNADEFADAQPAPARKRLAVDAPVEHLHLPPLEDGGESVYITQDGTEVDEDQVARAQEAAKLAGIRLREIEES